MTDTAADGVARDLKGVMHQLANAGANLAIGKTDQARELMKQANISLTALRVRFDQVLGPRALPAKKRRR